jgi:5-(carboxyamino)imidazole ribonucleotide mutase
MLAINDADLQQKLAVYKESLKTKIVKANDDLKKVSYNYKTN